MKFKTAIFIFYELNKTCRARKFEKVRVVSSIMCLISHLYFPSCFGNTWRYVNAQTKSKSFQNPSSLGGLCSLLIIFAFWALYHNKTEHILLLYANQKIYMQRKLYKYICYGNGANNVFQQKCFEFSIWREMLTLIFNVVFQSQMLIFSYSLCTVCWWMVSLLFLVPW